MPEQPVSFQYCLIAEYFVAAIAVMQKMLFELQQDRPTEELDPTVQKLWL